MITEIDKSIMDLCAKRVRMVTDCRHCLHGSKCLLAETCLSPLGNYLGRIQFERIPHIRKIVQAITGLSKSQCVIDVVRPFSREIDNDAIAVISFIANQIRHRFIIKENTSDEFIVRKCAQCYVRDLKRQIEDLDDFNETSSKKIGELTNENVKLKNEIKKGKIK